MGRLYVDGCRWIDGYRWIDRNNRRGGREIALAPR
jgi:hypothetical protein